MSEYTEVERPFLDQLATLGWTVIDQGGGVPQDASPSLRSTFRQWLLPQVFDDAVRAIKLTDDGREWLTPRQLEDLRAQLLRQPNRSLLEANEAVQACTTMKTLPSTPPSRKRWMRSAPVTAELTK